jgi:hypothetical protein
MVRFPDSTGVAGPAANCAGLEIMVDNRYETYQIHGGFQPPLLMVVRLW